MHTLLTDTQILFTYTCTHTHIYTHTRADALADDGGMTGNSVADASMRRPPPRAVLSGGGNNPVSNIVDAECAWSPPPVPRRPSMEDATHNSEYDHRCQGMLPVTMWSTSLVQPDRCSDFDPLETPH